MPLCRWFLPIHRGNDESGVLELLAGIADTAHTARFSVILNELRIIMVCRSGARTRPAAQIDRPEIADETVPAIRGHRAALLIIPLAVNSQPPGGGWRPGRGGRGGRRWRPAAKAVAVAADDAATPRSSSTCFRRARMSSSSTSSTTGCKMMSDRMARPQGITNGQITRDQFNTASESVPRHAAAAGGAPGGDGDNPAPAARRK